MRTLVYGLNYAPELTGIGKYTGEMSEWLAARGHEVRVVCAVPYYPEWRVHEGYRQGVFRTEIRDGLRVYRSGLYVPRRPRTGTRLMHLMSFAVMSLPLLVRQLAWRPEVVVGVAPTLFCAPGALVVGKLCRARTLLHIQDFEVDAMSGLGMGRGARLALRLEGWVMRRFDALSTISHSMAQRAAGKVGRARPVLHFPNWIDVEFAKPGVSADFYRRAWGILQTSKVVLYAGNMGEKQGLSVVLEAARRLQHESDVLFLFVGAGAAQEGLQRQGERMGLDNVRFYPLQPYERLPELMALGDVHLVVQRRGAADAVLPSKLTTILAAGGDALITAEANTELGQLCARHPGIATRVEPEDPAAFTDALRGMLAQVDVTNRQSNLMARAYAEEHLDKEHVLLKFEADLQALVGKAGAAALV